MNVTEYLHSRIPDSMAGQRLDHVLAELFPEFSRSRLQQWIKEGKVLVDNNQLRSKDKVKGGESINITVINKQEVEALPEAIPLHIVYEDDQLLVIDKPAGLVVHPAVGNRDGTLLNALLFHAPELSTVPRAGIVHRLDKNTSGLLVIARTLTAQTSLVAQLQARTIEREYDAIVNGVIISGGVVDAPIGRHPVDRKRMAVVASGKPAVTHYRVAERFRGHSHLKVRLETGRTHQIRVHMAYIHYPLVGDPVYGGRLRFPAGISDILRNYLKDFHRQALHASRLKLVHPKTTEIMQWQSPLPGDMTELLAVLREDTSHVKERA